MHIRATTAAAISLTCAAVSFPPMASALEDVSFSVSLGRNASTLYEDPTGGGGPYPASVCNTVAACDTAALSTSPGAIGSEDSWGVANINSISPALGGGNLYQAGSGGLGLSSNQYLSLMFYGLQDYSVDYTTAANFNAKTEAVATGAYIDIYALDNNPLSFAGGPSGRDGSNGYTGLTDQSAPLWLRLEFATGALNDDRTLLDVDFSLDSGTGDSSAYLNVIGGSAAALFDTNSVTGLNGETRDAVITIDTTADATAGWSVRIAGNLETAIPVPATLWLLGAGLVGVGAMRRFRKTGA